MAITFFIWLQMISQSGYNYILSPVMVPQNTNVVALPSGVYSVVYCQLFMLLVQ